jgi:hypothetical protein
MMVTMMAITPSLKASSRLVLMGLLGMEDDNGRRAFAREALVEIVNGGPAF